MRILLVEDYAMIGDSIRSSLMNDNCIVDWIRDGQAAEEAISTTQFDVMLLDLGLPGKSGMEVLRKLRRNQNSLPVIVVTARDAVDDRINGLDAGADDYVVKPFDVGELHARIRSALRRSQDCSEQELEIEGVRICPAAKQLWRNGEQVYLSAREYAIIEALTARPGTILSRAQLEHRMYGWADEIESNAIEVHIHAIRRKLGSRFIRNVRGVGYFIPKPKCAS